MSSVNVTIRIDEDTKREFDVFCENVGMNLTTAFNLFIKATLRTRELPFPITDIEQFKSSRKIASQAGMEVLREMQEHARVNGLSDMSLDEINEIISEVRKERRG